MWKELARIEFGVHGGVEGFAGAVVADKGHGVDDTGTVHHKEEVQNPQLSWKL
jgi:hypothetical protein